MFKEKIYSFKIQISENDLLKAFSYRDYIQTHLLENKRIPNSVIKKYLSFYTIKKDNTKTEEFFIIDNIRLETFDRFLNDNEYNKFKDGFIDDLICNLFVFLHKELESIWKETEQADRENKIINIIYEKINELCGSDTKHLTKYAKFVLTGFIIFKLGFMLSTKLLPSQLKGKEPTNHLLYE